MKAVTSLQNFIKMSPDTNFIIILGSIVEFLENIISQSSQRVINIFKRFY